MVGKVSLASCSAALLSLTVWGCTGEIEEADYSSFGADVSGEGSTSGTGGATSNLPQAGQGGSINGGSGTSNGVGGLNGVGGQSGLGGSGGIHESGGSGNASQGGTSNGVGGSGGENQVGGTGGDAPQGGSGGTPDVPSCQDACNLEGEESCNGNAVIACERGGNGCLSWQTQETCGSGTSCNDGNCTQVNNCTNECTSGATLCDGTIMCVNNDADPCLEWSAPPVCPDPPNPTGPCKRGVAANVAPNSSFNKGLSWWYNWASGTNGNTGSIEFAPMIHNGSNVNDTIPVGSKYLLGFNEPNRYDQANLSVTQTVALWPKVEAIAATRGAKIVSTAMSYCGSVENPAGCHEVSPYDYLTDFFAACPNCKVDYVAVHWYNCDIPSLDNYIKGFYKFGKPIWLTEFACAINGDTSVAGQQAYMEDAVEYLEANPNVYRYSWFSADPIPQAKLINNDGSPTALGNVYINLPNHCQ
jgi:hypothetical protein